MLRTKKGRQNTITRYRLIRVVSAAAAIFAGAFAVSSHFPAISSAAEACENVIYRKTAPSHKRVADAMAALDKDDYAKAFKLLDRYRSKEPELQRKIEITYLTANMRRFQCSRHCKNQFREPIDYELSVLLKEDKENPLLQALWAEALGYAVLERTALPKDTDAALAVFRDLEKRDLMPDSESWAVYGELLVAADSSDIAGRQEKLAQCEKTAVKARNCVLKNRMPTVTYRVGAAEQNTTKPPSAAKDD